MVRNRHDSVVMVAGVSLAAVLSVVGCKSKSVDDATLNASLQSRLQADPGLAGQAIQATVQNGAANLSGTVSNQAARTLAADDAAGVAGIRTVYNNLVVSAQNAPETAAVPPVERQTRPVEQPTRPRREAQPAEAYNPPVQQPSPIERRDPGAPPSVQPAPPPVRPAPPASPAFRNVSVPVGTEFSVRITQTLDSATTQAGTTFSGVLASDVVVDGLVAFPAGARVTGHVDDARDAGHFSGNSLLAVSLTGISKRGEDFSISTDTFRKEGNGRGKNTAEKVGGGAAVGAILGGIFGGGKGAAIGAGAGGGLGAGANGVTRGQQVQIPSESLVSFRLTSAVTVKALTHPGTDDNGGSDLRRHDQ